ncbi:MAG: tetratricopeptide repeat protein [Polyangiales bacterium]
MPKAQADLPVARSDYESDDLFGSAFDDDDFGMELELPTGSGPSEPAPLPDLSWADDTLSSAPPPFEEAPTGEFAGLNMAPSDASGLDPLARSGYDPDESPLEFSEFPGAAGSMAPGAKPIPGGRKKRAPVEEKKLSVWKEKPWLLPLVAGVGLAALIMIVGLSLKGTKYGLFGEYAIEQYLPSSKLDPSVATKLQSLEKASNDDTFKSSKAYVNALKMAYDGAGTNRAVWTELLTQLALNRLRFGSSPEESTLADAIQRKMEERQFDVPNAELAKLAHLVVAERDSEAPKVIATALQSTDASKIGYAQLIAAELAMSKGDFARAEELFGRASKSNMGARASWGLARVKLATKATDAESTVDAVLKQSPDHAAAKVAKASLLFSADKADEAFAIANGIVTSEGNASDVDMARALTLEGAIEERRGRRGNARDAYQRAAKLDKFSVEANLGAARLLLLEGNARDALARYEAVLASGRTASGLEVSEDLLMETRRGAARALIATDRVADARKMLQAYDTPELKDINTMIVLAELDAASDQAESAIKRYQQAIALDASDFRPYAGLVKVYRSKNDFKQARAVLKQAETSVPMTAEVRRLRGYASLDEGALAEAVAEFNAAIELNADDVDSLFGLAIAQRRMRAFDLASQTLDKAAAADPSHPGIAVERGMIAQQRGDLEGAATIFAEALKANEGNAELKTRLGATMTELGRYEEAEKLLTEVLENEPSNALAIYYQGRVNFHQGRTSQARQDFMKAIRIEPDNGEYQLYLGWSSLERNDLATAKDELDHAIELDPSLSQAYFLRAKIKSRTGAVRDAIDDLQQAVKLNDGLADAYAEMSTCYDQLDDSKNAIVTLNQALERDSTQGAWWFRMARLKMDEGKVDDSLAASEKAIAIGEKQDSPPGWLANAHRLAAEAYEKKNRKQDAIKQYQAFWNLASQDHVERPEVERRLRELGAPIEPTP